MSKNNPGETFAKGTVTMTKRALSGLSLRVRTDQFWLFKKLINPRVSSSIVDVGATSEEVFQESNFFEKLYPWPEQLTVATIENEIRLKKLYPNIKVKKIYPHKKLPFKSKSFDVVVSWATLEHVGSYKQQEDFINELLRVGKKVFITTPYRGAFYEPHSGFFFLHWLPLGIFRKICLLTGKNFWADEGNLNPLYVRDILKMKLDSKIGVKVYKMFKIIPSHLIIYKQ